MFGNQVFDTIIATVLIFLIFSSIVSAVVEWRNNLNVRQKRQMYLFRSVMKAFDDLTKNDVRWAWLLYNHPLISSLKSERKRFPVYISASTFAEALLGVVIEFDRLSGVRRNDSNRWEYPDPGSGDEYDEITRAIGNLSESRIKRLLVSFLNIDADNKNKVDQVKENIKTWFNNSQDRVIGEYRKSLRRDLFWYGFLIALFFNINFITILHTIITDGDLRRSLVAEAERTVSAGFEKPQNACADCDYEEFYNYYENEIDRKIGRVDSALNRLVTSGLPVLWEIPRSPRQIRTNYLLTRIEALKYQKEDTLDVILGRYCLVNAFIDNGQQEDSVHQAIVDVLKLDVDSLSKPKIDTIFKEKGIKMAGDHYKELLFFYQSVRDSLSLKNCLPTPTIQEKYDSCLTDCGCVDRITFTAEVIKQIDDRIQNYEYEVDLYDELFAQNFARRFAEWCCLPYDVFVYNIRSVREFFIYIFGALIMAIAGSGGSSTWFDLLVKLFQVRRAGSRPTKAD